MCGISAFFFLLSSHAEREKIHTAMYKISRENSRIDSREFTSERSEDFFFFFHRLRNGYREKEREKEMRKNDDKGMLLCAVSTLILFERI